VPKETRTFYSTLYILTDNTVFFFGVIYFWKISNYWGYYAFIGLAFNAIGLAMLRFIPESPQWLFQKARFEEAQQSLETIAKFNSAEFKFNIEAIRKAKPEVSLDEIDVLSAISSPRRARNADRVRLDSYLSNPKIRMNLFVVTMCWFTASFNYYMVTFLLKYFPGDFFVNCIVSSSADITACAFSGLIYQRLGAKQSLQLCYVIATVAGAAILAYEHNIGLFSGEPTGEISVLFPVLILVSQFFVTACFNTLYIANSHLFPVLFVSTAQGISNFIARLSTGFSPQLAEVHSLLPMTVFTLNCLATSIATCFLVEKHK